ncbi:MAG: hypothetical protein ACYDEV_15095 [Acidiferrobacter sp.]
MGPVKEGAKKAQTVTLVYQERTTMNGNTEILIVAAAIGMAWGLAMTAFAIWSKLDEDKDKHRDRGSGP